MKLCLIPALLFLLSACAGFVAPSIPPVPLTEYESSLQVEPLWNIRLGKGVGRHYLKLSPVLDDNILYALERGKQLAAFNATNGKLLWSVLLDAYISGGLGDGGDFLLLGADADVIAIDKGHGQIRWRTTLASEVQTAPVMASN
ncbi:MAG: PQQ-binding-like beta-propeller repeat protein, partial [Gammaproteobacteria bacterium]|nr:PQQ-binding-like beta-propeller repeat protein [Gammaproteobacteria bacterium]